MARREFTQDWARLEELRDQGGDVEGIFEANKREYAQWQNTQARDAERAADKAVRKAAERAAREAREAVMDEMQRTFTWTQEFPTLVPKMMEWIVAGDDADTILAKLRATPEHKAHFPGFYMPNGELRFQGAEGEYNQRHQEFVGIMTRRGAPGADYNDRQDWAAFLEHGIDGQELSNRWDLYDRVAQGAQDIKDAYYVYAGLEVTEDDLYRAIVNPDRMNVLVAEYNSRVALSPQTWETWVERAATVSVNNALKQLQDLVDSGYATQSTLDELRAMDPTKTREMIDMLAQELVSGPDTPTPGTPQQTLAALTQAFQFAVIGSAATVAGLDMTSNTDLLKQAVEAGVTRAEALRAYSTISIRGSEFDSYAKRAGFGSLGREDLEGALLLNTGPSAERLRRAVAAEQAQGVSQGSFRFDQTRTGMIRQRGFRPLGG